MIDHLGKGSTKKEKFMSIIASESYTDMVESLGRSVDCVSQVLSKGVHSDLDQQTSILSLSMTELILYYLLQAVKQS